MVPAVNEALGRAAWEALDGKSSRIKVPLPWMEHKYPIPDKVFSASRTLERLTPKESAMLRCDGSLLPDRIFPAFNWFRMISTTDSTVVVFIGLPA